MFIDQTKLHLQRPNFIVVETNEPQTAVMIGKLRAARHSANPIVWTDGNLRFSIRNQSLNIFLMAVSKASLSAALEHIRNIRQNASPAIIFAPIIVHVIEPTQSIIHDLINAGVDNILVKNFDVVDLEKRIEMMKRAPMTFFETATYFGPDRRRNEPQERKADPRRGVAPSTLVRSIIIKRTSRGIEVVSETSKDYRAIEIKASA